MMVDDTALFLVSGPDSPSDSGDGNSPNAISIAQNGARAFLNERSAVSKPDPGPKYLQPDLWIRGSKGAYRGNNAYGNGQKARNSTRASRIRANFGVVWENDSVDQDDGSVLYTFGNTRGFKTKYFAAGGIRSNLTGSVKTGGYRTATLSPGGLERYSVKVRQGPRSRRLRFKSNLHAVSLVDPAKNDTVQMEVVRRR